MQARCSLLCAGGRRFEKLHASLPLAPTLTGACIACSPQGAYSTAVYGAPDRVDLDALRIVHTFHVESKAATRGRPG